MTIKRFLLKSVGFCLLGTGYACFGQTAENARRLHTTELTKANASVERAISLAEQDSLRPIYHVTAAARFINDPNGPVYFNGEYHIFFQHLPFWGDSINNRPVWGHAVSRDMVHWQHLPIALAPTPGSYDKEAIASGCCVIYKGVPTIIYTGVGPQTQCLATSHDSLRTWIKDIANPVIPEPPLLNSLRDGFRDPFAWREGEKWRLLVGSAFQLQGGTVLLYQSDDLHKWEFLGPLCTGMGERCIQWECPTFFPLSDKHVLIVSPLFSDQPGLRGMVQYAVGSYRDNRFEPGRWEPVDLGGPSVYYAPNSFEDPRGRRILWGWIMAARPPQAGWWGSLSLPRVVTLASDGTLQYAPLQELNVLRYDEHVRKDIFLKSGEELLQQPEFGLHYEIFLEAEVDKGSRLELRIGRSPDGHNFIPLAYDARKGQLIFGDKETGFRLNPGEKTLSIRLFVDGIVGEAYINGRACFSNVLPLSQNSSGISILATGGDAIIKQFTCWKMNSIWHNTDKETH
jgi:beta-fructofuranosidase